MAPHAHSTQYKSLFMKTLAPPKLNV
ncbi:uncharacterized protein G2W53_020647 [Senna tora]|uniref:Uncharacterized protein n=1 Tax=Senna tora TaxID=362788 RepID=A0A834TI59_9FABA|nr:uncharacterized protein G2W53_020647 [Senna tora]